MKIRCIILLCSISLNLMFTVKYTRHDNHANNVLIYNNLKVPKRYSRWKYICEKWSKLVIKHLKVK